MRSSSRISGFYKLSVARRRELIRPPEGSWDTFDAGGLDIATADEMVENVVGTYALPLGIALNFRINERDVLVPMAIEEPSVVAAASNAARMIREGGGFRAEADASVMTAQVQLVGVADAEGATRRIAERRADIFADAEAAVPNLCRRGGGPREVTVRTLATDMLVVDLAVDCCDAMGANLVNTVAEAVAPRLRELAGAGCATGLRILTNLSDRRCVTVHARVPAASLACGRNTDGAAVLEGIVGASRFAELDPYRAATHNKGIMNGVDAVLLATGQDWRGVEAGAHAYAALQGSYRPLATWRSAGRCPHGSPEDAHGRGHGGRRAQGRTRGPGAPWPSREHAPRASWRASSAPRAWPRTWRPCGPFAPMASSAVTWPFMLAPPLA